MFYRLAALLSLLYTLAPPLSLGTREVIIRILIENPLEFRVSLLTHQIRQLWPSDI